MLFHPSPSKFILEAKKIMVLIREAITLKGCNGFPFLKDPILRTEPMPNPKIEHEKKIEEVA